MIRKCATRLARSFDNQCSKGKYFGPYGKRGGTFRCQLIIGHPGSHQDAFGRKWRNSERSEKRMSKKPGCYEKAVSTGQKSFTLIEQDYSAPETICEWIKLNINAAPAEKLREALDIALGMRSYVPRKTPD